MKKVTNGDLIHVVQAIKDHPWCPEVVLTPDERHVSMWQPVVADDATPRLVYRGDIRVEAVQTLLDRGVLYVFAVYKSEYTGQPRRALRLARHQSF